jgi:hypothetical protein
MFELKHHHAAMSVPSLEASIAWWQRVLGFAVERELRAHGADIVFVKKHEMGANIFIRDNAGNLIEFVQQPEMFP